MNLLDLTLPTPAENLALDEALLEAAEAGSIAGECLRLWESPSLAVVLGRASRVEEEANRDACRQRNVSILRRRSGGAAVVIGPGCLMYSLVLSLTKRPAMRMIDQAHGQILQTLANALKPLVNAVQTAGTSDLTLAGINKFSGNSLRVSRNHLLYHGTVLYDFDLPVIGQLLKTPPRQPDYRQGRDHTSFVVEFPAAADAIRQALKAGWQADGELSDWPRASTQRLVAERYSQDAWNFQR